MDHEIIKKAIEFKIDDHIYGVDHSQLSHIEISERLGHQALLTQQGISSPASDALDYVWGFLGCLLGFDFS